MAKNTKQTSPKAASAAGKTLNNSGSKTVKTAAASALAQTPPKKSGKK